MSDDILPSMMASSLRQPASASWLPRAHVDDTRAINALLSAYDALVVLARQDVGEPHMHAPRGPRHALWRIGPMLDRASGDLSYFLERRGPDGAWHHLFEADSAHQKLAFQTRYTDQAAKALEGMRAFTRALVMHHPMLFESITQIQGSLYLGVALGEPSAKTPVAPVDTVYGGRAFCDNKEDLARVWRFRFALSRLAHQAAAAPSAGSMRTYTCGRTDLNGYTYKAPSDAIARLVVAALSTAPALWPHNAHAGAVVFFSNRGFALDSLAALPVHELGDPIATRHELDSILPR